MCFTTACRMERWYFWFPYRCCENARNWHAPSSPTEICLRRSALSRCPSRCLPSTMAASRAGKPSTLGGCSIGAPDGSRPTDGGAGVACSTGMLTDARIDSVRRIELARRRSSTAALAMAIGLVTCCSCSSRLLVTASVASATKAAGAAGGSSVGSGSAEAAAPTFEAAETSSSSMD